ncbi:acetamidase/formamidase family protein [Yinghuangia seranimata]|uniref:acetamidase/formamidase family protein n=1 Tax=Yinghuangia seranimata TaxID=408067 RepID=UPI00248D29AE|nr:acetamidase/formamidase family protein [Yinghuangia seranimata]MDI2132012.1 acetamidase/formamidase family protein [Yinghuangia seranimata]
MSRDLLSSRPGTVLWGWLPGAVDRPVLSVEPGATVVVDTLSHQGLMRHQGRDPHAFFASLGVDAADVLDDVHALAASDLAHDPAIDGPHVVTGPIEVRGARPGDVLAVHIEALEPRVGYGVVAPRDGGPGPEALRRVDDRSRATTEPAAPGCAFRPSLGVLGVATSDGLRRHSARTGSFGGNLDLPELGPGATLHLPVQVPGALFHVGGPRFGLRADAPGTAWDGPLRATIRLDVVPQPRVRDWGGAGRRPFVTTPGHLVPLGLDANVDRALELCRAQAFALLAGRYGEPRAAARARLEDAEFRIHRSGYGVHARLPLPDREPVGATAA